MNPHIANFLILKQLFSHSRIFLWFMKAGGNSAGFSGNQDATVLAFFKRQSFFHDGVVRQTIVLKHQDKVQNRLARPMRRTPQNIY